MSDDAERNWNALERAVESVRHTLPQKERAKPRVRASIVNAPSIGSSIVNSAAASPAATAVIVDAQISELRESLSDAYERIEKLERNVGWTRTWLTWVSVLACFATIYIFVTM